MNEPNQIRINELARELEVKAKVIIDYLPEAGVTEKKTHSSSIDVAAAVKVRQHFHALAEAEAAAEEKAASEKAATPRGSSGWSPSRRSMAGKSAYWRRLARLTATFATPQ